MAIRRVIKEYEAKLAAVASQSASGKIECKTYGDGAVALRVRIRDLDDVAPDYPLRLFVNNVAVGALERIRDKAELELNSRDGHSIPAVGAGDEAQLRSGELIISQGVFYED